MEAADIRRLPGLEAEDHRFKTGECRSVSPERCAEICESASFRLTDHTVGLFKD
jgi:hypothetical protein